MTKAKSEFSDTYSGLLAAIPSEVLDRFPETAGYLKSRAQRQDAEIARILAARHIETAFLSTLTPANLASPSALLALDGFFGKWKAALFPSSLSEEQKQAFEREASELVAFVPASPEPIQAALPSQYQGISDLVELFKEQALSDLQDVVAGQRPLGALRTAANALETFRVLSTWTRGRVHNVFHEHGSANQAANVLHSIINESATIPYAASRWQDGEQWAANIKGEAVRRQLAHEMIHASPERTQEVLAMLRTGKIPDMAESTHASKPRKPR